MPKRWPRVNVSPGVTGAMMRRAMAPTICLMMQLASVGVLGLARQMVLD
jgi:hypothetical protein